MTNEARNIAELVCELVEESFMSRMCDADEATRLRIARALIPPEWVIVHSELISGIRVTED